MRSPEDNKKVIGAPIITMHGPDGCGKSTIASALSNRLKQDGETLLIGGSSFSQWLTPEIYKNYIGSCRTLEEATETTATQSQKTRLYEDIAVCLLGVSKEFASRSGTVVIDSDPFLKRLTWARATMSSDQFDTYVEYFDKYVSSFIGNTYATHMIEIKATESETFNRIRQRGEVSGYDPSNEKENSIIHRAASYVGQLAISSDNTITRLRGVEYMAVTNEVAESEEIYSKINFTANNIYNFISRGS